MAKSYTYDPSKILDGGVDNLRFDIGDTEVEGNEQTCALCDEEYLAMITKAKKEGRGWNFTICLCLKAIHMKFSFEVDSKVNDMSLSLQERYKVWEKLYLRMMKNFQVPYANGQALGDGQRDGGHYFRLGQNDNPRIFGNSKRWSNSTREDEFDG